MYDLFQYQQKAEPVRTPADVLAEELSWIPSYPDFARDVDPLVQNRHNTGDTLNEIIPVIDTFLGTWGGYQPAVLWEEVQLAYQQFAWAPTPAPVTDPKFWAFKPTYPDFARSEPPSEQGQQIFVIPLPEIGEPNQSKWSPTYPDFARTEQIAQHLITSPFRDGPLEFSFYDPREMGWKYEEPVLARQVPSIVEVGRTMFAVRVEFPKTGFLPTYPDFAKIEEVTIQGYPSFFMNFSPSLFEIPELSWEPEYPSFARGPVPNYWIPADHYWIWERGIVDPEPPIEEMGWRPYYPDFATGKLISPELYPFLEWYTVTGSNTLFIMGAAGSFTYNMNLNMNVTTRRRRR